MLLACCTEAVRLSRQRALPSSALGSTASKPRRARGPRPARARQQSAGPAGAGAGPPRPGRLHRLGQALQGLPRSLRHTAREGAALARRLHVPPLRQCFRTAALLAVVCVLFLTLLFWANKAFLLVLRSCMSGELRQRGLALRDVVTPSVPT